MPEDKEYGLAPPRDKLRSPEQDRQNLPDTKGGCTSDTPVSAATHEESQDYMRHFSSPACYAEWAKKADSEIPAPAPAGGKDPAEAPKRPAEPNADASTARDIRHNEDLR